MRNCRHPNLVPLLFISDDRQDRFCLVRRQAKHKHGPGSFHTVRAVGRWP